MLKKIAETLKSNNSKLWVMYNHEASDPYFRKYISDKLDTMSFAFITPNEVYILVSPLDKENASHLKYSDKKIHIISYKDRSNLQILIEEIIAKLNFPNDIMLTYSTLGDKNTDILPHGSYVYLTKLLKEPYKKYNKKVNFSSSEKIIYDIAPMKSKKQIDRMKLIASITDRILEETFSKIRVGMSEIEISNLTIQITKSIMNCYIDSNDIIDYDFSWENCPIVLTGINLAKGGHTVPSEKELQKGDTVYFDFGIKVKFKDNEILCTDIQRMGYALKDKEKAPPAEVKKVFNTLVSAIENGVERLKAGTYAYEVDETVRKEILKEGYPDYMHATGHPVGEDVHDVGPVISIKASKLARFKIPENSIYTLEPRINIENGGSIEEMFLVTKFGGVPLCNMQTQLYLIK